MQPNGLRVTQQPALGKVGGVAGVQEAKVSKEQDVPPQPLNGLHPQAQHRATLEEPMGGRQQCPEVGLT